MAFDKLHLSNHKTVFVLDHAPFFNYGCNNPHEFDFSKSRVPGVIPLAPIDKSLWTCCVESALEYCRVVWDIFPSGKLISFIISDSKAHRLNTWSVSQQNLAHVIDVPHNSEQPIQLSYDPEWLAVLLLTNHLLSVKATTQYMPGPGGTDRWVFNPSSEEMDAVKARFEDDLQIPLNFVPTAPPFDPMGHPASRQQRNSIGPSVNPQTTTLCECLGIDDPMVLNGGVRGVGSPFIAKPRGDDEEETGEETDDGPSSLWSISTSGTPSRQLHSQFSALGAPAPPPSRPDHTVVHGLKSSIELLSQCSELQHERRTSLTENASKVQNRTRVICLTSVRDDQQLVSYEEYFLSMLLHQNKVATGSDNLIPIHHCHLVVLNVFPNGQHCDVRGHLPREMSPVLTVEAHSIQAGGFLSTKLSSLILNHYNLASTTVTGIPMKEEQNASSSANYDVEIFHPISSHQSILGGSYDTSLIRALREGSDYETVTLKWCTPRGSAAVELQHCTMMQRITPVDVNSRPSSCLINFLLSGRSVMLEMPRRTGGKVMSHLLAAHGGEIFIHTLSTTRSVLEDPPSISEGSGGRVTDYRITDFAAIMRANKLLPLKRPSTQSIEDSPVFQMKKRLDRYTKYWPMTISSTMIFNLRQHLDPLLGYVAEEEITDEQVMQCQHVIFNLVGLESRHEPLNPPTMGHKGKGPKRDEQYRTLWNELETYIRANCNSENHRKVLSCLLECRNKPDVPKSKSRDDKVGLDQALRELDPYGGSDESLQRVSVIRATTDSPMSPPLHSQHALGPYTSLLDIWVTKVNIERTRKGPDFYGRTITPDGAIARLYTNLKTDGEEPEK